MMEKFELLITKYKTDPESVYNTWFANNDERLKAFRTIRRGVQQVINALYELTKKEMEVWRGNKLFLWKRANT